MEKLVITVALTGNVPTKKMNPSLPVTPAEIAADVRACADAGACLFHVHARDGRGEPTYHSDLYRDLIARVRGKCPDAVICVSTSGRAVSAMLAPHSSLLRRA